MQPSHLISLAQINLISVNEYALMRNVTGQDIIRQAKGTPSLLPFVIACPSSPWGRQYTAHNVVLLHIEKPFG